MIRESRYIIFSVAVLVLQCFGWSQLQARQFSLVLRDTIAGPPVLAVTDAIASAAGVPGNPFWYDCVAFFQIKDAAGNALTLRRTGQFVVSPQVVWVVPTGDSRKRPALAKPFGPLGFGAFVVLLRVPNPNKEIVVRLDSAEVVDSSGNPHMARNLSIQFSIPNKDAKRCGRIPDINFEVAAPDGGSSGVNIMTDVVLRRPFTLGGGGVWEILVRGSVNTSEDVLLNNLSVAARFDFKVTKGWEHWVTLGATLRLETTESRDTVDLVVGARLRARLDFIGLDEFLRPFLQGFTPYPMVTVEYNVVDPISGDGDVSTIGPRPRAHRIHLGADWKVPLILDTTVRLQIRGDYFLSDPPPGRKRFQTLLDVTADYPLSGTGDIALMVKWLEGSVAPAFNSVSQLLAGVKIGR